MREVEWRVDAELFLNKYLRCELGAPHWSVILYEMFLHAAEWGQKEAERLIHWGHYGSTSKPNLEAGQSTMELVAYQTPHKEIRDVYQSVYLLRRSPSLPPSGAQQRVRTICNLLSSLTNQLHQHGYPPTTRQGQGSKDKGLPRPSRRELYEEALEVACQRALETAEVLRGDIKRLSQGMRYVPVTCSRSRSRSCTRSHSRSRGGGCSLSLPWNCSQSGWQGSLVGLHLEGG